MVGVLEAWFTLMKLWWSDCLALYIELIRFAVSQCADVFFLKADICQLGLDQRKVRVGQTARFVPKPLLCLLDGMDSMHSSSSGNLSGMM